MARIAGVDLPREKRVEIGLTYIYGIGRSKSSEILAKTGINPDTRVRDLTDDEVGKLRDIIDKETEALQDAPFRPKVIRMYPAKCQIRNIAHFYETHGPTAAQAAERTRSLLFYGSAETRHLTAAFGKIFRKHEVA